MKQLYFFLSFFFPLVSVQAQIDTNGADRNEEGRPITEYELVIEKNKVTLGGISSKGMTVNGSIPGPTLTFTEGDLAIVHVTNKMDVETSVHWHGLILPNFYDGVPYLTTPPIKPGTTFTYRIPLNQSGTYWYHSHTMLQEQSGVYGSILIKPKKQSLDYDKDLVVVLSDWTNEKPMNVLRNLKRGNEWYQVRKGTAVPLSRAIANGGFGAQLKMWRDRMEGADIADVYYPTFLINGQKTAEYPEFKPGEKVRLRFINASSSTYFWLDFGGKSPLLVSSDGVDVEPVHKKRLLFAIAETYDFIVRIPDGTLEITATAQDGSGHTSLHLGHGDLLPAQVIARPDKVEMMKQMAKMDMKMGAPALKAHPKKDERFKLEEKYGMKMKDMDMKMPMEMKNDESSMPHEHTAMPMKMDKSMPSAKTMSQSADDGREKETEFDYQSRKGYFNYDFLKAKENTAFADSLPVHEVLFNLTGNMNRYVWSINGVPLNETDKIRIKKGEVTRFTLNNLTMMHHPMHLHGHYFRVINKNGSRSPLKHTVNVPPMQKVTIELYGEEYGDWFFHCHVLYHMMSGMTRVFSYNTPRDPRMQAYPLKKLIAETDRFYSWGTAELGSNFSELRYSSSNIRNEFSLDAEIGYNKDAELEISYNRYINDWVRLYVGINTENSQEHSFDAFNTVGKIGLKYFTPYMFYIDLSIDNQMRPTFRVNKEFLLFPRFFLEGQYEYQADLGVVNNLEKGNRMKNESKWKIGGSYILSRNFSIMANYHNLYGWGGGLTVRF
ncbi:multicopper oxidase domain-containing protein [Marinilongibacter aquaticus]|uniref:multicopper oxidase domain-containing protein n=1 Tax=Marinilongibacter aquaticus TaxID=2975157 RepID=UPI0021BD6F78|nr:multicopper oxidase domain-containing protein [Marinilongibacter aquaticus]UBM60308.1 multicopper oxidase domain-containing protein [Marinilongibacter aquaticus]